MNEQLPTTAAVQKELDPREEKLRLAAPALGVAFVFLFSALLQTVIHALVSLIDPALTYADWYLWVVSSVPMYFVAMPLSLWIFRLSPAHPPKRRSLSPLTLLSLCALCFGLTYAGNLLGTLVNLLLGTVTGGEVVNELAQTTVNSPFWTNLLFAGILAPIMEEIFFRKLIIDRISPWGELPAILISGVAFGLIHGNFSQFFYAAALGMLFGAIYLKTGKLRYTVALHMAINLVGGVFATEVVKLINAEAFLQDPMLALSQNPFGAVMLLIYLGFMALILPASIGAGIYLCLRKREPLQKGAISLTAAQWRQVILCNPGVWLFLAVAILLFL